MELDEAITVIKIITQIGPCYLLVGWKSNSFEMYLYHDDNLWKGKFSPERLQGLSKNLKVTESVYFTNVKLCLSQQRNDYIYELKNGFFYWKKKVGTSVILEGFLPVKLDKSSKKSQPNLLEVLLAINKHLTGKVNLLKHKLESVKIDHQKSLSDTEEFLNLKINMEKALSKKFLTLLNLKKINERLHANTTKTLNTLKPQELQELWFHQQ